MMRRCPYCGKDFERLVGHEESCVMAPENLRATRAALIDVARPGVAKARSAYDATRKGAPPSKAIVQQFGSWRAVCEYHNLRMFDGRALNGNNRCNPILDAPLTDAERHACARRGATQFAGECGLHSHWRVVDVR